MSNTIFKDYRKIYLIDRKSENLYDISDSFKAILNLDKNNEDYNLENKFINISYTIFINKNNYFIPHLIINEDEKKFEIDKKKILFPEGVENYFNKNIEKKLLSIEDFASLLKHIVKEYINNIVQKDEKSITWPLQSYNFGWSATGKGGRPGIMGTILALLTLLECDTDQQEDIFIKGVSTFKLMQENDGGWPTNQSFPLSIIPSTSSAILLLKRLKHTENLAYDAALKWIIDNQLNNGSWGLNKASLNGSVFLTARTLLTLPNNNTTYIKNINNAFQWLKAVRNPDGSWSAYGAYGGTPTGSSIHTAHCLISIAYHNKLRDINYQISIDYLTRNQRNGIWRDEVESLEIPNGGNDAIETNSAYWYYAHYGTPWCILALLKCGVSPFSKEICLGMSFIINEILSLDVAYADYKEIAIPIWRIYDNIYALNFWVTEIKKYLNGNHFFISEQITSTV